MGATLSKLSSVTSRNSLRSDFLNTVPSSMPSPMSLPQSSPIRSILFHQSRSGPLSHEKPITRVTYFFRWILSPDAGEENKEKDLDLWKLARNDVRWLEERLQREGEI